MPCSSYASVSSRQNVQMMVAIGRQYANLQVNPKMAHGWVKSGAQEWRTHTGGQHKALMEEQVDTIYGMIEDQGITLKALKQRILVDFQLNITISMSHNYLEGQLLTLKKIHYITADANNGRNKTLHIEYVQAISAHIQDNKTIIWIDEMNVNLYCQHMQGRAPPGQQAVVTLLGSKGPNVHVIAAITNFQVIK